MAKSLGSPLNLNRKLFYAPLKDDPRNATFKNSVDICCEIIILIGDHDIVLTRTDQNPDGSAKCEVREGKLSESNRETSFSHESLYYDNGPITEMVIFWGRWEFFSMKIRFFCLS